MLYGVGTFTFLPSVSGDRGLVIIAKDGKGVMGEQNTMAIDKTWCRQLEHVLWLVVWEEEV
jgi:hypothetical protein